MNQFRREYDQADMPSHFIHLGIANMPKFSVIGILLSATIFTASTAGAFSDISNIGVYDEERSGQVNILAADAKKVTAKSPSQAAKKGGGVARLSQPVILSPTQSWRNVPVPNAAYPSVNSVAVSSDGSFFVTGNQDGIARLWDISSGTVRHNMKNHHLSAIGATKFQSPVRAVAISPDGKTVATGSAPGVAVFNAQTGVEIRTYNLTSMTSTLAYSPNGQLIAAANAGQQLSPNHVGDIKILDANSGAVVQTIPNLIGGATSVSFSPDGTQLASAGVNGEVIVWDVATGQKRGNFDSHSQPGNSDYARSVAFSPDGQTLATGGGTNTPWQGKLKLWDVKTGSLKKVITDGQPINSIAFNGDGTQIAAANWDKSVRLYSMPNGILGATTKVFAGGWNTATPTDGHTGSVNSVVFGPTGKLLFSGGSDHVVKSWRY